MANPTVNARASQRQSWPSNPLVLVKSVAGDVVNDLTSSPVNSGGPHQDANGTPRELLQGTRLLLDLVSSNRSLQYSSLLSVLGNPLGGRQCHGGRSRQGAEPGISASSVSGTVEHQGRAGVETSCPNSRLFSRMQCELGSNQPTRKRARTVRQPEVDGSHSEGMSAGLAPWRRKLSELPLVACSEWE